MMKSIPPTLGAGDTIALSYIDVPVNIGKAGTCDSTIGIVASPNSPIGPKIIVSVNAAMPDEQRSRAHMAHLDPHEALWLANALCEAVAELGAEE